MKVGYNEACGLGCSTLEQDLDLCEEVGFDVIEIRYDMLRDYLTRHTLGDLEAFFSSSRLRPATLNATYVYPGFLGADDDLGTRDPLLSEFIAGCSLAQRIGAPGIVVVPPLQRDPLGGPYLGSRAETDRECPRILARLADLAADFGLELGFEPVGFDRSSVRSVAHAKALVDAAARPNLGLTIDSYNLFLNGGSNDFSEIAALAASDITVVHLINADDVPAEQRAQDRRLFPGPGAVDLAAFLAAVTSTGYDGVVSVETFRPEYWERSPEWVVKEAFAATHACLASNDCL